MNTKTEYFQHITKWFGIEGRGDKEVCILCRKFGRIKELQEHEQDFYAKDTCTNCKDELFGKKFLIYHIGDRQCDIFKSNIEDERICPGKSIHKKTNSIFIVVYIWPSLLVILVSYMPLMKIGPV